MNPWGQLIDRLTDRLAVDRELQLDVARELTTHLEDSAEEFRRAGESEEQAAANAARALGDPDALADQLWQANRGRLRIRGILRWTAQVALVPAAIVVIAAVLLGLRGGYPVDVHRGDSPKLVSLWLSLPWHSSWRLTAEQRFILDGPAEARTPLERAKAISDRCPENAVFYGNYAVYWMAANFDTAGGLPPHKLQEALAILDHGAKLDPNNAFYDIFQATYLVVSSCQSSLDPNASYSLVSRSGKATTRPYQQITITDPRQFQEGMACLRRGLARPFFTNPAMDMMVTRLELMPQPKRLNEYFYRLRFHVGAILPPINDLRELGRALLAAAVAAARQGRAAEASSYLDLAERLGVSLGANTDNLVELMVAQNMRLTTFAHAQRTYDLLGQKEQAARAYRDLLAANAAFNGLWKSDKTQTVDRRQSGILEALLTPSLPGYRFDPGPLRSAEYYVAMEFGLLALLACLLAAALLLGAVSLLNLLRRKENRPILVFVGWPRLGRICLLAVVLPFGGYALYRFLAAGNHTYGLNYTFDQTLLELVVLLAVVLGLLTRLSYSAIRRRAEELGMTTPPPIRLRDRRWMAVLGAIVALAVLTVLCVVGRSGFMMKSWTVPEKSPSFFPGIAMSMVVAAFLVISGIREYFGAAFKRPHKSFRRTLYRSMVPILAAAVILTGVFLGWGLGRGETSAIERVKGLADFTAISEIDRTDFRLLKDQFIQRQRELAESPLPAVGENTK